MFWNGRTAIDGFSGRAGAAGFTRRAAARAFPRTCPRQEMGAARAGDVLEFLLAEIDEGLVEPVARLPPGVLRNEDAAGLADPFEARCDIDAVAHEVAVVSSTTSPRWTPIRNSMRRSSERPALRSRRPSWTSIAHRTASTTLRNSTRIPSPVRLTIRPMMGSDGRIDQIAVQRPEPRQRALLVEARKPAEADHVGGQDRGELSRLGHEPVPRSRHDPSTRLPAPGDAIRATC